MFSSRQLVSLVVLTVARRSFASEAAAADSSKASSASGTYVRVDRNGPIAELVMARPKAMNSVGEGFFTELKEAINFIDNDREVRAAILRAEGKIFCAGLDLKEASGIFKTDPKKPPAQASQELFRMMQRWHKTINQLRSSRIPIIAAAHSKVIGAGVDLISACDIRYCTADAEFSMRQTQMAIVPDLGTLQFVPKLIGSGQARELAFTGRDFSSAEALQMGFVNKVFPNEADLLAGARKLAAAIAANSPLAVQGAKYILNFAEEHTIADGLDQMAMWNAAFLKSDDLFAAIAGFATKTKPTFSNTMAPPPK